LILDHVDSYTVNPTQDDAKENTKKDLDFCAAILLLGCQAETGRIEEAK
jgi:hypothetical protein